MAGLSDSSRHRKDWLVSVMLDAPRLLSHPSIFVYIMLQCHPDLECSNTTTRIRSFLLHYTPLLDFLGTLTQSLCPTCPPFVTRKNIRKLSIKERDDLVRAWDGIQKLDPTHENSFFKIAGYHGEPFRGAGWGNRKCPIPLPPPHSFSFPTLFSFPSLLIFLSTSIHDVLTLG